MVNIVSVISIGAAIRHFDSWDNFWAFFEIQAGPQRRAQLDRMKQAAILCEQTVAQLFNVPVANAKDIYAIFGSSAETIRRLQQDDITKNMLLDPNNKVVLQIKHEVAGQTRGFRIATVYSPQICHTVKTMFEQTPRGLATVSLRVEE